MKYMLVSTVIPEQYEAAWEEWAKPAELQDGVELLGAWHVGCTSKSFNLFEADSLSALTKELRHWQGILNMELFPVMDNEEARKEL